jgi:hypothetical protein
LSEVAPETVLAVLDSNVELYATENLAMVTVVLEKCNERRPLLDHLALCKDYPIFGVDELWRRCIQFHSGPVIDPIGFVRKFDREPLTKSTRNLAFDIIERLPWTENSFREAMRTNHVCIGRKAAMWLRLGYPVTAINLIMMVCNSYKALDVVFDRLVETMPHDFFETFPAAILSKTYQNTHEYAFVTHPKADPAAKRPPRRLGLMAPKWRTVGDRKLVAAPYIRYARAVMPKLGKEKVFEFMRWHVLAVDRSIRFLADVLGDVKENGLDATDFDGIFEGMKIIADLKPPFDRELLERFAGLLQDAEVSARYEFPRREELIGLVLKVLEPDDA